MNFFNGHPIFGIDDPAMPELLAELREEEKLKGTCHGITFAATIVTILGSAVEATTFAALITVGNALVYGAIAVGLSYAAGLLAKRPEAGAVAPASGQVVIRQALPPRIRSYGTVCVGGAAAFEEVCRTPFVFGLGTFTIGTGWSGGTLTDPGNGDLYLEILQGQGEINAVTTHFIGNTNVIIDGSGEITTGAPFASAAVIQIYNKLGAADQTVFQQLKDAFPDAVDDSHRWRGVAKTLIRYRAVPTENIATYYGGGVPPYRCIQQAAMVYDPRDVTQTADGDPDRPRGNNWTFSENGGRVILDYMRHPDGFKRKAPQSGTRKMVPIAKFYMPEWIAFINCCDEDVPLKAGGTEKRYRLCGTYDMTADPKDILQAMQDACDAEVYPRGDGTIGVHGGKWDAPEITIDNKYILSHSLRPGSRKLTAYNVLNIKYTAPDNDFQLVDMDPLRNEDNIALRGEELNKSVQLTWCPSHSQARRIAKIMMAKENPNWQGSISVMPFGLKAVGQRTINFVIPDYGINGSFLRTKFQPSSDLSTIAIEAMTLDASAYAWDPDTEEGTEPPIPVDTAVDATIPVPADFAVIPGSIVIQDGVNASILAASWTLGISTYSYEINWQADGALSSDWISQRVPAGTAFWTSPVLQDATAYNVRVRALSPGAAASAWSSVIMVSTTADVTAPGLPTGFASSKSGSDVTLSWTNPNSPNFYKTVVYRAGSNSFGSATAIATLYGVPGSARSYADNSLANGTYYWWVQSFNASGVPSTQVGPTTQTIP